MNKYLFIIVIILLITFCFYLFYNSNNDDYDIINLYENENTSVYDIDYYMDDKFKMYNPSILKYENNYIFMGRISNYTDCPGSRNTNKIKKLKNYVFLSKIDKNFNLISYKILDLYNIEDLRIIKLDNEIIFTGSFLNYHNNKKNVCPCVIKDNKVIKLYYEDSNFFKNNEKNWSPILINNSFHLISEHNPLIIVKPDLESNSNSIGSCKIIFKGEKNKKLPKLRGNTPYINIGDDKYLGITHTRKDKLLKIIYSHYFTLINLKNNEIKISEKLCLLGNCGIEFVCGFIKDGNDYLITLGKNDCTSHIVKITEDALKKYISF